MKITKKIIKSFNDNLTVIMVLGILIMVNILSSQISFRFDLTDNRDYSVSKATKKTAAALDDIVNIKTYFSRNLPPKYLNLQQEVHDILAEYANSSNGKIRVDKIDPSKIEKAVEELGQKGIPTLQFNVLRNDSFEVVNGYLGLTVEYAGKSEVIPVIDSTKTLEYDLTSAIKKLTAKEPLLLGIVSSHGAVAQDQMTQAYGRLGQIYSLMNIDLKAEDILPENLSALLLVGVKERFEEKELKKIDSFVMSGRPVIFLVDGVNVNPQTGAIRNLTSLEKIFNAYGVSLNYDLVADVSSGRASFSAPGGAYYLTYQINYPLWPKILPENFNSDNVIVAGLSSVILPWSSSLSILEEEGREAIVLIKTTDKAVAQDASYDLEPEGAFKAGGETEQYNMAILTRGKMKSPFNSTQTEEGKVVLVGDSNFVQDAFSGSASDNLIFFQNLVDAMVLDSDLIDIRSKGTVERPIKPISNPAKELMRYLNLFGAAVLVLVFGFVRYFLRRRSKSLPIASLLASFFKKVFSLPFPLAKKIFSKVLKKKDNLSVEDKKEPLSSSDNNDKEAYKDIKN